MAANDVLTDLAFGVAERLGISKNEILPAGEVRAG
jgi:hypothetical protein